MKGNAICHHRFGAMSLKSSPVGVTMSKIMNGLAQIAIDLARINKQRENISIIGRLSVPSVARE